MNKNKKSIETVTISKDKLVSLVASKLKDKILFPKKFEEAKKYASNLENVQLK